MYIKYLEEWDPIAQSAVNLDSKTYKKEMKRITKISN